MKKEKSEQEVRLTLEALCVTGEHCMQEMREKMIRWGIDDEVQQRILNHLVENRFIDEERYARAFVKDKAKYNKWGRRKIEQALWAKRIPQETIREALDEVDGEEYVETLRRLLKQKKASLSNRTTDQYTLNRQLLRFALGRGFTYDIIRQCIDTDYDEDMD